MVQKAKTMTIDHDLYIEGFIISHPQGKNNELNVQRSFYSVANMDLSTAYIESVDGEIGFRLYIANRKMTPKFPRYARVVLSLTGTTLKFQGPCRVTVNDLTDAHIVRLVQCTSDALPRKEKSIAEITDNDIYTYLTLKDCEFVFKDGAYSNVYERYVVSSSINKKVGPNDSMDCWPTLMCDKEGSYIYSLVNTLCTWRRDGRGVPQGSGDMKGILVYTWLPRYGGDVLGGYSIRPVDRDDYAMLWDKSQSAYKSIAEWNWNDISDSFNTESGRKKSITNERVKADVGDGLLSVQVDGAITRGKDMNNPRISIPKENDTRGNFGIVNLGSLTVCTEACNWWNWEKNCGKGIQVEFSTEKLTGENIIFGFSFAAGDISAQTSYGFPVYWNVEFSTDGKEWFRVRNSRNKKLRSLPWWYVNSVNGDNSVSIEAGAGFTEHAVTLPKSLFGQPKVYVRVVPVTKNMATLGYDYSENGALRPNSKAPTLINFGSFVVRYN